MSIIGLILLLLLIIVGVVLGFVPMDARIKMIVVAVIAILVLLELCSMFGLLDVRMGHSRHW